MKLALDVGDFFLLLSTLLVERRAAIRGKGRIAFAVVGAGSYVVDLEAPGQIEREADDAAETFILCNQKGLSRLASGSLEAEGGARDDGVLFLWSGEREPLLRLSEALGGGLSLLQTRISAMKGATR